MKRHFNVNGVCRPGEHYMVDITDKLKQIKAMVDAGKYFTINRARQYGKTTTLQILRDYLKGDYTVICIDFQMLSYADFETEPAFAEAFVREMLEASEEVSVPEDIREELNLIADGKIPGITLSKLFKYLTKWCGKAEKPLMLEDLLFSGKTITYNPLNPIISIGEMFGFLKEQDGMSVPANRIFDTLLYNYFLSVKETSNADRFIIEMKIWRGEEYHKRGELQLAGYLDDYHIKEGYMLSFNFNKNKQAGIREVVIGEKKMIEAVV